MGFFSKTLFVFFAISSIIFAAEVRIEITDGVNSAQPIGIVPFKCIGMGSSIQKIDKIISSDLRNTGKFNPIELNRMPQLPSNSTEIIPKMWRLLGANAIVVGQIELVSNNNFIIKFQLVNIIDNFVTILSQNTLKITKEKLRYAGHSISDEIFEKLTGIRGAFRTRIAYIVVNNSRYSHELRVSDYDGYNSLIIHRSKAPLMSPTWSPDGKSIAYVTFESGKSMIVIRNIHTGYVRNIASFPNHNGAPAFSSDGTKLAFALSKTGSLNLYVMDLLTGKIRQITNDRNNNTEPKWMPDNQNLLYTSDKSGRPQIYKININSSVFERISWEGMQNQNADISPDGTFMVTVNSNGINQHIVKYNFVKNNIEFLTKTFLDETPSISPNGIMIIYASSQEKNKLYLVSVNGRYKTNIPINGMRVKFPAWSSYL
ncbi:Tol-Pal system beta propeller repeat protein TolB [Candidatus Providencia siddallii]|uniref:Tol-Pal system protein TolB n=1 Tax=Candidatus Providencia siddallii TaxID=1715285 RepID=A0ABP1CD95_9GAMM